MDQVNSSCTPEGVAMNEEDAQEKESLPTFKEVLDEVMAMPSNREAQRWADMYGMVINRVSWEDCARLKGTCIGPNISDMTLQVEGKTLPVIRYPNFTDLTWDIPMEDIPLVLGNEAGEPLYNVNLKEYLSHLRMYLHNPEGWTGSENSLLAPERDENVLVSAQACFLPVMKGSETQFNVCLYNYQSRLRHPAVLVIVASANGTSAQIIERHETKLFFNKNGQRAPFVAQRLSDNRLQRGVSLEGEMTAEEESQNVLMIIQVPLKQAPPPPRPVLPLPSLSPVSVSSSPVVAPSPSQVLLDGWLIRHEHVEGSLPTWKKRWMEMTLEKLFIFKRPDTEPINCVSIASIEELAYAAVIDRDPKKNYCFSLTTPRGKVELIAETDELREKWVTMFRSVVPKAKVELAKEMLMRKAKRKADIDVEEAILSVGQEQGPYTEIGNLPLERDPMFPVRVTLQFYKSCSTGNIDEGVVARVAQQIKESRSNAKAIGSLVLGEDSGRSTEWQNLANLSVPPWWESWWLTFGPQFPHLAEHKARELVFLKKGRFHLYSQSECHPQILRVLQAHCA